MDAGRGRQLLDQLHVGDHRQSERRPAHAPQLLAQCGELGWHLQVSDRDVLLHTLPMFHANGWGMPYATTAMCARHVVLRKVDGEEILRRVESEGVTLLCGAPAVVAMILDAAASRASAGVSIPGRAPCGWSSRAHRRRDGPSSVSKRAGLGVRPDLRADGDLAAAHDQPGAERVGRT